MSQAFYFDFSKAGVPNAGDIFLRLLGSVCILHTDHDVGLKPRSPQVNFTHTGSVLKELESVFNLRILSNSLDPLPASQTWHRWGGTTTPQGFQQNYFDPLWL